MEKVPDITIKNVSVSNEFNDLVVLDDFRIIY